MNLTAIQKECPEYAMATTKTSFPPNFKNKTTSYLCINNN
jgi:hypothetical protein